MSFERRSKRFYARARRHDGECYNAVANVDPDSRALAYLKVHSKRETLVWRADRDAPEVPVAQDTYVLGPHVAGDWLLWVAPQGADWPVHAARVGANGVGDAVVPFALPGRALSLSSCPAAGGGAWVVWEQRQGTRTQVWLARATGDGFGEPVALTDGSHNVYDPAIAQAADGTLWAAYTAFVWGNYHVLVRTLDADGRPTGEPRRLSARAAACMYPSLWPAGRGGVWFSYTAHCGGDAGERSFALVQHFRFRGQKGLFGMRGLVHAGRIDHDGIWVVGAPRGKQGFSAASIVQPSVGAGHSHVLEDARGRLRLLVRQHGPLETASFADADEPLTSRREQGAVADKVNHADLRLMTLADDDWTPPELLVPRAHLEMPISFATDGRRLRLAFTEDARRTGWSGTGEWFDDAGQTGVGAAEIELADLGEPDYDWHPLRMPPRPGPSITSPPVPPDRGDRRLIFGQTHKHTDVSVCLREIDREAHFNYRFMQDVQGCGFGMTADHAYNMWHTEMLWVNKLAAYYYFPGEFVAAPAYEWTGSGKSLSHEGGPFGHVNPLYLEEDGELDFHTPCDPSCAGGSLRRLWRFHHGRQVVTPPHHVADHLHAYNWEFFDDQFVCVVELFQDGRGSAESPMAPGVTNSLHRERGHWIVDQLRAGKRFGFIAGGDHMGVALAGVYVRELTRTALYEALRARRCFATTSLGLRVEFECNGQPMGQAVEAEQARFRLAIDSPEPIHEVHVLRDGEPVETWSVGDTIFEREWSARRARPGEFWYCRIVADNGEMAWTSPIWLD